MSPRTWAAPASIQLPTWFIAELTEAASVTEVLDTVARCLPEVVHADRASVALVTRDGTGLEVFAMGGIDTVELGAVLPVEGSLLGQVFRDRRTINFPDISDAAAPDARRLVELGLRSVVNAPLISAGECFGTINLGHYEAGFFGPDTEVVLDSLGRLVGASLRLQKQVERLEERNRGMAMVLDNVDQGFLTIDRAGRPSEDRSAVVARWFNEPAVDLPLPELFRRVEDDQAAVLAELNLDQLEAGVMPDRVVLAQMPGRVRTGDRILDVTYRPFDATDGPRVLVVMSDVTSAIATERAEAEKRELLSFFERMLRDRSGFADFVDELDRLVAELGDARRRSDLATQRRILHTIKGNAPIVGMERLATVCHELETAISVRQDGLTEQERARLEGVWTSIRSQVAKLDATIDHRAIEVDEGDLTRLEELVERGVSTEIIRGELASWRLTPVACRLERLALQGAALAERVGKADVRLHVEGNGIRLATDPWRPLWSSLIHAVRNAIDHGIEDQAERDAAGKPGAGAVSLVARRWDEGFEIIVEDDGRGIDWATLELEAAARGLPSDTEDELIEVLFADGITSRREVTETSGRGIGMGALRETARALGGEVLVDSRPARGTRLTFRFPERVGASF